MTADLRRSAEEQARFEKSLIEVFEQRIAFNQVLGIQVQSLRPGDVRLGFAMRPELVGHYLYGRLHGGVSAAVLDALGGLALMVAIAERHPAEPALQVMQRFAKMGTIDLRTDFLRPGTGQSFVASAEVLRLGGRVGTVFCRLVNDEGSLIATATGSYVTA